ncbi:MAG: prephenate dehydratase [Clostridia bacterium]|nr:prephenate dehydratase [Clostridia bacterium]
MGIEDLRKDIDSSDKKIAEAFEKRMETAKKIAEYKKENGLPVLDLKRERAKLNEIASLTKDELKDYIRELYCLMFDLSKSYQNKTLKETSELSLKIQKAVEDTEKLFPETAMVACQGVEGANSETACDRIFKNANIMFFNSFEAVFTAVEKGLCKYGVIPVENSTAGSVNSVYDLMMSHNFYVVKSIRLKIDHNLLVKPGVKLSEIKEIYSHEQAINQCSRFLQTLQGVKVIACENTAAAAKMVSESDRRDVAAIASIDCTKYYGLTAIEKNIQNSDNNYTRFICISKQLEIYPGAEKTSLMMTLPHKPGALYNVLSRFYTLGINLLKLESRPIPGRDFEFMFYFDLDIPVYSEKFIELINDLPDICDSFTYLGTYSEVI